MRLDDSDERVAGGGGDPAHVLLVPGDPDVSLVPPGRAPAVLDQPVRLASLLVHAVADGEHAVVQVLGAALLVAVDAAVVELEALVTSIDGDAAGTLDTAARGELLGCNVRDKPV